MPVLDFKHKECNKTIPQGNKGSLFAEKILSNNKIATKTFGRLNCHAWKL